MYSEKILHYIQNEQLIENGDHLLVAVSSGPDSMCLLHYLLMIKKENKLNFNISVAHVNHHTRGHENDLEEQLVNDFCVVNHINFYKNDFFYSHVSNFHDEARRFRYLFFKETAQKINANKIAVAHHIDDQVETILFKLIRGTNISGYTGMANKYMLTSHIKLIRPFLNINKDEILGYCKEYNIPYLIDSSNHKNDYSRNMIRNEIIPKLSELQSDIKNKLIQFKTQIEEVNDYLYENALNIFNESHINKEQELILLLDKIDSLNKALLRKIITFSINKISNNTLELTFEKQNNIIDIIYSKKPNITYNLGKNIYLIKEYNELKFTVGNTIEHTYKIEISDFKEYILPNSIKLNVKKVEEKLKINNKSMILCYNNSMWPLIVRTRKNGDKIKTSIGHKKINRIFINHKIPLNQRESWPIITDKDDNILWVIGLEKADLKNECDKSIYIKIEVK